MSNRPVKKNIEEITNEIDLSVESKIDNTASFVVNKPLLKLTDVTKKFGPIVAVNNVSFQINRGERVGIIGANGSGKTTISEIIAGLTKASSGEVEFGFNILTSRREEVAAEKTKYRHAKRAAKHVRAHHIELSKKDTKYVPEKIESEYQTELIELKKDFDVKMAKFKEEKEHAKLTHNAYKSEHKQKLASLKSEKTSLTEEEFKKRLEEVEFELRVSKATLTHRNAKVKVRMDELVSQRNKVNGKVIRYTRFFESLNKNRIEKYRKSDTYKNAFAEYKRVDGLIRDLKFVKVPQEKIGMQFQDSIFPSSLTLQNIIGFAIRLHKLPISEDEIYELLKIFQMEDFYKRDSRSLSGGQRQKLNIFLALLHNPELIILDEISTGLDLSAREEIIEFVNKVLKEKNIASILISHHMDEIEALCDRVIVFDNGSVFRDTTVSQIKKEYGSLAEFMRWIIKKGNAEKKPHRQVSIMTKVKEVIK